MITTIAEVYEIVRQVACKSHELGYDDIATHLDDAMCLGSSGLEILGSIRNVLIEENLRLGKVISKQELKELIVFIDKSFGR